MASEYEAHNHCTTKGIHASTQHPSHSRTHARTREHTAYPPLIHRIENVVIDTQHVLKLSHPHAVPRGRDDADGSAHEDLPVLLLELIEPCLDRITHGRRHRRQAVLIARKLTRLVVLSCGHESKHVKEEENEALQSCPTLPLTTHTMQHLPVHRLPVSCRHTHHIAHTTHTEEREREREREKREREREERERRLAVDR